jgi:hypothetical protein
MERFLWTERVWFSDRAAWQWLVKSELLSEQGFCGDIAIIGSSISFHSLDPVKLQRSVRDRQSFVNLALNGLTVGQYSDVLDRYISYQSAPKVLVLEIRSGVVDRSSWLAGPWWRFFGDFNGLVKSGIAIHQPELIPDFFAKRIWASYCYGPSLDNFITACLTSRSVSTTTFERNRQLDRELRDTNGFSSWDLGDQRFVPGDYSEVDFSWSDSPTGESCLGSLLRIAESRNIEVVLMRAPAPFSIESRRREAGFDKGFERFTKRVCQRFPELKWHVFEPSGFEDSDFVDDHHLSEKGGLLLIAKLFPDPGPASDLMTCASELASKKLGDSRSRLSSQGIGHSGYRG